MTTTSMRTGVDEPNEVFSARLRRETTPDHSSAEGGNVMIRLLRGDVSLEVYLHLLVQLEHVYSVLEECSRRRRSDARIGVFLDPVLERTSSLAIDRRAVERRLGHPGGPILPSTTSFTDRIETVTESEPLLLLAHHYTRYLGDLSGGIMIGRSVDTTFDFAGGPGVTWFQFPDIADIDAYKNTYRAHLDALDISPREATNLIDEVHRSYSLNGAMLGELSASAS